jgi:hypothetical protein
MLGETMVEDQDVVHGDRPFCTVCGSLRTFPGKRHMRAVKTSLRTLPAGEAGLWTAAGT